MSRYYYSRDGTDVQGPISDSDLQEMRSAGLLSETTQICEEGTEAWRSISFLKAPSAKPHIVHADRVPNGGKYVCPQCGGSNIQSVPLLYEAGTSTSVSNGRVIGVAGLGTDHLTPAGGMTTTTHRQQTLLAARYSPPSPQKASNDNTAFLFIAVVSLIGFGVALLAYSDDSEGSHSILIGLVSILAGAATVIPAIKALKAMQAKQKQLTTAYVKKLEEWQQSFVCQKCGYFGTIH